jgi:hypothetical protein
VSELPATTDRKSVPLLPHSKTLTQKFPWHASWLQSQSSSIVSPVPSQDALQYLPSGGCGHVHGGFLHLLSSAMISSGQKWIE